MGETTTEIVTTSYPHTKTTPEKVTTSNSHTETTPEKITTTSTHTEITPEKETTTYTQTETTAEVVISTEPPTETTSEQITTEAQSTPPPELPPCLYSYKCGVGNGEISSSNMPSGSFHQQTEQCRTICGVDEDCLHFTIITIRVKAICYLMSQCQEEFDDMCLGKGTCVSGPTGECQW